MKFRPCIDIHNGSVKQIVGGTLSDRGNQAEDNFVSEYDAAFYANMYREDGLTGGHIILLNKADSEYYEADLAQAKEALTAFPRGLQIGGGVNLQNAESFLDMQASHVIVTSFVFRDGRIDWDHLKQFNIPGRTRAFWCWIFAAGLFKMTYHIVTDRWQKVTKQHFCVETLEMLSEYCDEFLVHAVDVEGKTAGIEKQVIQRIGQFQGCPMTYAGGIHSPQDLQYIAKAANETVDYTIGSALDLFGGSIAYKSIVSGEFTGTM